ncbi:MAG: tRNA (adenosine(37)-N6)-dimethylallyltransferase MiaA [Bacteroidia bacterium]
MQKTDRTLVSIVGPTAVGKTRLAIALAQAWNTEIVNCDARQVYKYLDVGTAKPNAEERAAAPHHLIDTLEPSEAYNARQYASDAEKTLLHIFESKPIAIAVGGSTLYSQALWRGLDDMPPVNREQRELLQQQFEQKGLEELLEELQRVDAETWETIDRKNPARVIRALEVYRSSGKPISSFRKGKTTPRPWNNIKICLNLEPRKLLYDRINFRVEEMMKAGLVEELKAVLKSGVAEDAPGLKSIGYSELVPFIHGDRSLPEAVELIKRNSRRYAKRQLTWWRRESDVHWLDASKSLETQATEVADLMISH